MKAIITVLGSDKVGIIAKVTAFLAENNINIMDISQTTMQNIFTMIMLADISGSELNFKDIVERLDEIGKSMGVQIKAQHEDIFKSMHEV